VSLARLRRRPHPPDNYVIVGRILSPHGVRGEVKVEPITDNPERFKQLRQVYVGDALHKVVSVRVLPKFVLVRFEGMDSPEQAKALSGMYLYIPKEQVMPLPEDTFYHFDLQGMEVVSTSGEILGTLREILVREANDVFVVDHPRGEILIPAIKDVVKDVDLENRRLVVELIPGLLPWES